MESILRGDYNLIHEVHNRVSFISPDIASGLDFIKKHIDFPTG